MSDPSYNRREWELLHPWPARLGNGRRIEYLWRFEARAPPDDVWRVLSDTSRVNRALDGPEMHFTDTPDGVRGWSVNGGVRHEWVEVPWNWVAGHWLEGARLYGRGFLEVMHSVTRIDPAASGGSIVHIAFQLVPRGRLGAAAVRFAFPSMQRRYARVIDAIEPGPARPGLLIVAPPPLEARQEARLGALASALHAAGFDAALVERVARWVRTGDEQDLARIQVRERARSWQTPEDELLSLFLHATREGLFQLSWDVVCPHCRGVREEHGQASGIPRNGHCPACAIDFETEDSVEITFHVHPSVRPIEKRVYCAAEPATKAHVRLQQRLAPGAELEVRPPLGPGRWRLRQLGQKRYGYLDTGDAGLAELTWRSTDPPAEQRARTAPALRLVNDSAAAATFVIEEPTWSDNALRPGRLLSFQQFRDLFSDEYLGNGIQLSVGEQTILFTDIVGSTALYARRGDPEAFVEVKRHFDRVFEIVAANRGAVVKTIGDAVMGAFGDPLDAVRASKRIHEAFPPPKAGEPPDLARLRISLNTGPCIAVRLNANIDYFGGTVNVAAKVQSLAEAWQVAMTRRTWAAPGVAEWVASQGGRVVDLEYRSRALPEPIPVKQWTMPGE
jgi:class 3 adenylate cyclase